MKDLETDRKLVLLAPLGARIPGPYRCIEQNDELYNDLLSQLQTLRGRIMVEEAVIAEEHLDESGRHKSEVDSDSWHLLITERRTRFGLRAVPGASKQRHAFRLGGQADRELRLRELGAAGEFGIAAGIRHCPAACVLFGGVWRVGARERAARHFGSRENGAGFVRVLPNCRRLLRADDRYRAARLVFDSAANRRTIAGREWGDNPALLRPGI